MLSFEMSNDFFINWIHLSLFIVEVLLVIFQYYIFIIDEL